MTIILLAGVMERAPPGRKGGLKPDGKQTFPTAASPSRTSLTLLLGLGPGVELESAISLVRIRPGTTELSLIS